MVPSRALQTIDCRTVAYCIFANPEQVTGSVDRREMDGGACMNGDEAKTNIRCLSMMYKGGTRGEVQESGAQA